MRISPLLLLLFCFIGREVFPQTFYREYGNASINEGAQAIIGSPDGNILVGGFKADSALVMKLDPLGNIIWSRCFKPSPNDNMVTQMAITPDNYIIGTGNGFPIGQPQRDGFYFKMDLNGALQWTHKVNDSRPIYCKNLLAAGLAQYILYSDIYDVSSATWPDVVSARIDAMTGNMTWLSSRLNYIPANSYIDDVGTAVFGKGGSMYSTGRIYVNGSSAGGMRVYQSKFDNLGNHLFSKFLVHTYGNSARLYGIDIIYDNDSLILCYAGDKNGASANFSVGLIKTDTLGNVIWSKDYNIAGSSTEYSQKVVKTTFGYVIFGYLTGATKDFFIIATDPAGNALWQKSYGTNASDEDFRQLFSPSAVSTYGYVYFTGRKTSAGNQNIIIARIDQTGAISCSSVNNITVAQTNNPTASTTCPMSFPADALTFPLSSGSTSTILPDACSTYSVNLGNDTAICGNPNLTLNATTAGATQYLWQNGATTSSINATSAGTYWVNVQIGNCCTISDTIIISGNTINTMIVNSNPVICSGGSSTLTATGGTTYSWNTGATTATIIISPSTTSTYSVVVSTATCTGTSSATVTVNPSPSAAITGNSTLCAGATATLTASGGTSYAWNTGGSTSSLVISPTSTNNYSVIVTDNNGCKDSAATTIIVNPLPTVNAGTDVTICSTGAASLAASGNGSFSWSPATGLSCTTCSNPTATTTASTNYSVTVTNTCGTTTDSVWVMINSQFAGISGNATICSGSAVSINASGGTNYSWNNGSTTSGILIAPTINTTYSVVVSTGSCIDTIYATVQVDPKPTANAINDTTILFGQTATLLASGGGSYLWNNGATDSMISVSPLNTTLFCVIVTNANNCSDTDCVTVTVIPEPVINCDTMGTLFLPNAFSPNTDNENDSLRLYYKDFSCIELLNIRIYNYWGEKIFESNDPEFIWDGTYHGKKLDDGVFAYYLTTTIKGKKKVERKGNISIIR